MHTKYVVRKRDFFNIRELELGSCKFCVLTSATDIVMTFKRGEHGQSLAAIPKVPKWIRRAIHSARYHYPRLLLMADPRSKYVYEWGRDCDQFESWHVWIYPNGRTALKAMDSAYECAEGPVSAYITTEEHYLEYRAAVDKENRTGYRQTTRDHALEQFEG